MTVSVIASAGGDYTTLSAWEAAQSATLTNPAEARCTNFETTEALQVGGITTSATNFMRIYTDTADRHDGRARAVSGTGFCLTGPGNSSYALSAAVNHLRLEGLEIRNTGSSSSLALRYDFGTFSAGANDHRIDKCIIHDVANSTNYTITASASNLILYIRNTIIYGFQRSIDTRNSASVELSNDTFWRHADQLGIVADTELTCKNTYSGKASGSAEDFWTGAAAPSGNNNISSDTSATTDYSSSVNSIAGSAVFTSVTSGSEDFTLKAGTNALVDAGATLGAFSDDIIGTSRPQGSAWDIGAFERAAAGGGFKSAWARNANTVLVGGRLAA